MSAGEAAAVLPAWGRRTRKTHWSRDEYLLLERNAAEKSEYLDGAIYAMAGASPRHVRICTNLSFPLESELGDSPCSSYGSDLKVKTPGGRLYTYPDVTVVCGPLEYLDEHHDVVTNPRVIFEVLSPGTEAYDRGENLARYRETPSLMEVALVSQDEIRCEVHLLTVGGEWISAATAGPEGALEISSLGLTLPLAAIYRKLPDEPG